jgi:hypothetical protein
VKFGADDFHAIPFSDWQFHETRCNEEHILLKGVSEIFPYSLHFGPIRIISGTEEIHVMPLSCFDYHDNGVL